MFKKILKGAALVGLGYAIYYIGYGFGLHKVDPVLQQLDKDLKDGKISIADYQKNVRDRMHDIEGGR